MKKILFIGGITGIGFAFYYFFKNQVDLALNYGMKIKDVKFLELTSTHAKIEASAEITNKSSFSVDILSYDLVFKYMGIPIADTVNNTPITIESDSSFNVTAVSDIDLANVKSALLPFVQNILTRKPIKLEIAGKINIKLLGIPKTIEFKDESFDYSDDLLVDTGLDDDYDKLKNGLNNLLGKIGINL